MTGTVEWAVLIFVCGLMVAAIIVSWRARSILAALEIHVALFDKDIRHVKKNVEQHAVIGTEIQTDIIRIQAEVARLSKLVNGTK